jgi:hypoxanthine phosphoribosyltransferase
LHDGRADSQTFPVDLTIVSDASKLSVLISEEGLRLRIRELADQIDEELAGESAVLIGVLKGSIHFLSDLGRAINSETVIDFLQTSSYHGGKCSTGVVQIRKDLDINIEGLNVIIVEDIVDTGITLSHLRELLSTRKPKSLKVVALLSKEESRKVHPEVEYIGFNIPNEFVVGYGLDYAERYRNLPYIAVLREE